MLVPFVLYIQKKRKNKQQEKGKNQAQNGQSNPASNILTQKSNQLQECLPVLSVYSCSSSLIFFFDWKHNYQPVKDPWSFFFSPEMQSAGQKQFGQVLQRHGCTCSAKQTDDLGQFVILPC
jgi:hypothetical protein